MYIVVLPLNFLDVMELSTERHFTVWTAKLNQHKGILISKFESKDMLLWKRGSSFVFTEDENLWIASRPICLMEQDPQKGCFKHTHKENTLPNKHQEEVWTELLRYSQILFVNVSLHLKGICYRDV